MKNIACFFLLFTGLLLGPGCDNTNIDNLELDRFEEEIVEFERENQYRGAPTGAVVFLGGAVIREWSSINADFAGMPVKNRAFGDATLREIIHYYRRLLDPFQAELIVMNAGANDILLGASPEQVAQSFNDFLQQIVISNRASRVVYISMIPTPADSKYRDALQRGNELIKAIADNNPRVAFVDVTGEYLGADGQPIMQMFESDGKSLNSAGYARLIAAVAPVVSQMF